MSRFYLVFTDDRGNREDCNVYYSSLVEVDDQQGESEALEIFFTHNPDIEDEDKEHYLAEEMEVLR
jgi:hypothetical protein